MTPFHGSFIAILHFIILLPTSSCCAHQWPPTSSPSPQVLRYHFVAHLIVSILEQKPIFPSSLFVFDEVVEEKFRLGSTPPSCRHRCNACNPCDAVQIPALPGSPVMLRQANDHYKSNYKPLGWRLCFCLLFEEICLYVIYGGKDEKWRRAKKSE
ncbi:Epidermal patterning factor-like protein 1 [Apostasia shenzhenica]|uniref:Epidermal patterning factor-like protein n=1 Tax=Apostasia shenzhenica TaxID=1088818 RepID=A0A2I0AMI3_9ASPA|nr:Epidermal patterning factor-like protein 1 [Apostasia shenzhenica]